MSYLLGSGTIAGIAGIAALAIYLAKMAGDNRKDLHRLLRSEKDLYEARRDNDGYRRNIEDRDNAIQALHGQIEAERNSATRALEALNSATRKLADRGDAHGVSSDINVAFKRLSEMSAVSNPEASEGGDD